MLASLGEACAELLRLLLPLLFLLLLEFKALGLGARFSTISGAAGLYWSLIFLFFLFLPDLLTCWLLGEAVELLGLSEEGIPSLLSAFDKSTDDADRSRFRVPEGVEEVEAAAAAAWDLVCDWCFLLLEGDEGGVTGVRPRPRGEAKIPRPREAWPRFLWLNFEDDEALLAPPPADELLLLLLLLFPLLPLPRPGGRPRPLIGR